MSNIIDKDESITRSNLSYAIYNKLIEAKSNHNYDDSFDLLQLFEIVHPAKPIVLNTPFIKPLLKGIDYEHDPTFDQTRLALHHVEILIQTNNMDDLELNSYLLEGTRTLIEDIILKANSEVTEYRMPGFYDVQVNNVVPSYKPDLSNNVRTIEVQAHSTSNFELPEYILKKLQLYVKIKKDE